MRTEEPSPGALRILAVSQDRPALELVARVLEESALDDQLAVATDLSEGLARTVAEAPDVVLLEVGLGNNAGLAVIHYLRSVAPEVTVYALVQSERLELGTQAVALGAAGLLMLPLSGDELLSLLAEVRTRRAEREQRRLLERHAARSERGLLLLAKVAEISHARTRREAASRLVRILCEQASVESVLVYLPAGAGSGQLVRTAAHGAAAEGPTFCDEPELLDFARQARLDPVPLCLRNEQVGFLLLGARPEGGDGSEPLPLTEMLAAQVATALALLGEREQAQRGAIKDPGSSAYTFAYFVDVAGREIDKACRHDRRFALAVVILGEEVDGEVSVQAAERILAAVRDTDILARVDEREFYLLLPETDGVGAHLCRRRLLRELRPLDPPAPRGARGLPVTVGVATFPHDGRDLSHLLRVARHRAEVSAQWLSWWRSIASPSLSEMFELLVRQLSGTPPEGLAVRLLELPALELVTLAVAAFAEARRGGLARLVVTHRPGLSLAAALRSGAAREAPEIQIETVDVSAVPGHTDLEALSLVAEHGTYGLLARVSRDGARVVHAADPILADLIVQCLGGLANLRLLG